MSACASSGVKSASDQHKVPSLITASSLIISARSTISLSTSSLHHLAKSISFSEILQLQVLQLYCTCADRLSNERELESHIRLLKPLKMKKTWNDTHWLFLFQLITVKLHNWYLRALFAKFSHVFVYFAFTYSSIHLFSLASCLYRLYCLSIQLLATSVFLNNSSVQFS